MSKFLEITESSDELFDGFRIHLDYEYLRPSDLGDLCHSIDALYQAIVRSMISGRFDYDAPGAVVFHPPELQLTEVQTGHSIELTVEFCKRVAGYGVPVIATLPIWTEVITTLAKAIKWGLEGIAKIVEIIQSAVTPKPKNDVGPAPTDSGVQAEVKRLRGQNEELLALLRMALTRLALVSARPNVLKIDVLGLQTTLPTNSAHGQ